MDSCNQGLWKPLKEIGSLLLFFADDLVLFSLTSSSYAHAIEDVLGNFCYSSSQKISVTKSRVVFSLNVDRSTREDICNILSIKEALDIGSYLSFPISPSAIRAKDFDSIIEKVSAKLSGWKAKLILFPGRVVLIQFVIEAILAYIMQCVAFSAKSCDTLNALNRNFLWGSS